MTVLIGVNGQEEDTLIKAGQPLPRPFSGTGVIDTGTTLTSVDADVLKGLGIKPSGSAQTQTAGGLVSVKLFEVSLSIPPEGFVPGPMLMLSNLLVMELAHPLPGVEVLIGMDVLLACRLILDGPARQFSLDF